MKKSYLFKSLLCAISVTALAVSCAEVEEGAEGLNPDTETPNEEDLLSNYVVAVSTTDGFDYLLYTDQLGASDLTVMGSGVETSVSSAQWYFYQNKRVFGLKYSDGDPAPVETYVMGSTKPSKDLEYTSYRFTTYGTWGDYMVTSSSNSYTAESTGVYEPYYNTEVYPRYMYVGKYHYSNGMFEGMEFESDDYLGTGEYTNISGFAESNGWLYTTIYPMGATAYGTTKYQSAFQDESSAYYGTSSDYLTYVSSAYGGSGSGSFKPGEIATTPFPDQFHLAIFKDEADFPNNPILIKDDRMSPACGRQQSAQYPTIAADQNEDVYIFSPGNERSYAGAGVQLYSDSDKTASTDYPNNMVDHADLEGNVIGDGLLYKAAGTHTASVMRIQKGETALDESYGVFDLETAMGDRSFLCCYFVTGSDSKFLVKAMNEANVQYSSANNKYYIADVVNKSAIEVTGMPEPTTITAASRNPYFEDGKAYVGITSSENTSPVIYEIDSTTGVATKIASVECSAILSIGKLAQQ